MRARSSHWFAVYGTAFFALSAEGMIGLVVPVVLLDLNASPGALGVLVSLSAVGPLFLSLPAGALCDRVGDRLVLAICAAGSLITGVLYFYVSSLALFGVLQVIGGTTRSVGWLAAQSYIGRHVAESERAARMGYFTFSANLGMLVSPPLVGLLSREYGPRAGFLVLASWSLILLVLTRALREVAVEDRSQASRGGGGSLADTLFANGLRMAVRPAVAVILVVTFLRLASVGISQSFYPIYLAQRGFSTTSIGVMFSLMFLASTLASPLMGALSRLIGSKNVLWLSSVLSIAGIVGVAVVNSTVAIAGLTLIHGIGIGLSLPALLAEVGASTAADERGVAMALRTVVNRLGYLVMPAALGGLVSAFGITVAFVVSGVVLLSILAFAMLLEATHGRKGDRAG